MWLTSVNGLKHEPRIRWTLSVTAQWPPMEARSVPLLLSFPNSRGQLRAHCGQTHSQKEEEGNELPFYHCPVVPSKITNLIHSLLPKGGAREGQQDVRSVILGSLLHIWQHIWQHLGSECSEEFTWTDLWREFLLKAVIVTWKPNSLKVMLTEPPTIKLENSDFQKDSSIVLSSNKYSLQLCFFFPVITRINYSP